MKMQKCLSLLLAAILTLSLYACGSQPQQSPAPEETPAAPEPAPQEARADSQTPEVVIDAAGREVTIPGKVERVAITCQGGTTHETAIFGGPDRIVAQPGMASFPQLLKMYPQFDSVVDAGSFDNVNIEELMKTQPDLVLVGVNSQKGNSLIEEAGMQTYTMLIGWAAVDTIKQEFLNLGKIMGDEETAEKLVAYWDEKLGMIGEMTSKVPEDERKVVYYTGKAITNASTSDWGWNWIRGAGGISPFETAPAAELSVEEVMQINPDVILTQEGNGIEGILGDDRVQELTAIKNRAVYECPIGAFWWDRPSPEAPLGFMWLAKTLYPDYTQEIDLEREAKDFFREFYHYELSDEEYQSFFSA